MKQNGSPDSVYSRMAESVINEGAVQSATKRIALLEKQTRIFAEWLDRDRGSKLFSSRPVFRA